MRILLPPSEGKAPRGRARSLSARGLEGQLWDARRLLLEAVSAWCAADPEAAAQGLSLPPSTVEADLAVNIKALTAGTMPAIERYQGVVFDGLSYPSMDPAERRVAHRTVLIASGGFGLLGAVEPVPDHRVPMSASVPGIGGLTPYWRRHLAGSIPAMVASRHLVVDLRSGDYAATPPIGPADRRHVLSVRVLTDRAGVRSTVSFSSKLTKGQIARALVSAEAGGLKVRKPAEVATILAGQGFRVEPGVTTNGQPSLDVILSG